MQILWATPFNTRSAIGIYSRDVCHELVKRGHGVRIMRLESNEEAYLPTLSTSIELLGPDEPIPCNIDLVVINYGNHAPYHAGALRIAVEQLSVAIFHDAEMRHFQWGMLNRHQIALPILLNEDGQRDTRSEEFDLVNVSSRPLLESLSAMAAGAIVHGPHYQPTVAGACPGPVKIIPLCFPNIDVVKTEQKIHKSRRIVMFGIISPYKQPDRLLRAISKLQEEFSDIEVHLAGVIEENYRLLLINIACKLGIPEPVFHGYLSDQDLGNLLAGSDVICCLRYPVTEGGSASLITALHQGQPLIVSNIASYSMVPNDLVYKVSYSEEADDLANVIREILLNPKSAQVRALRGRDWAKTTYSSSSYVDCLENFIEQVLNTLPVQKAFRYLADKATLPDGNVMPGALHSIAQAANSLFRERGKLEIDEYI